MSIFVALISLLLGLYLFKDNIVVVVIISALFIIYVFIRFGLKKGMISISMLLIGVGVSFIPFKMPSFDGGYLGLVIETHENYVLFQTPLERFYISEKNNEYEVGDILFVHDEEPTNIAFTTYESQFDFASYLKNKKVDRELAGKIDYKMKMPVRLSNIKCNFLANFNEETSFLIDAFLFNNKNYESSTLSLAKSMNLIFLFSNSGIYFSFLLRASKKLFSLAFKESLASIFAILLWLPYLAFTFPKIGLIRVVFVYLYRYLNKYIFKRKITDLVLLSSSWIIFLIIDHSLAYQSSFYLGFALSFMFLFLRSSMSRFKKRKRAVLSILFMYLFILPVSVFSTSTFHLFALLFQTIITPLSQVFVLCSVLSFYTLPFKAFLNGYASIISSVVSFLARFDISFYLANYGLLFSVIYYALLFTIFYLLESKQYKHMLVTLSLLISQVLFAFLPLQNLLINAVYFINVGQGDSILIRNANNTVLIDTGGNNKFDMASETLIPFLKKKQIFHLDALITTHNDFDHNGAATSLMANFKVNKYLSSKQDFPYNVGEIYLENINTYNASEDNDNSLIFNLSFRSKRFLLMGDASSEVEKFLIDNNIDIDCDILKVGHHGSKYSTSSTFLEFSSPLEAVISVGAKNYFHHPSEEVLKRLEEKDIKVRRTDIEGTICYYL